MLLKNIVNSNSTNSDEVDELSYCQLCRARRGRPRTLSRTTDANLDWAFVEKALLFVVPKVGRARVPLMTPLTTPCFRITKSFHQETFHQPELSSATARRLLILTLTNSACSLALFSVPSKSARTDRRWRSK